MMNKVSGYVALMRLNKPWGIALLGWPTLCALLIAQMKVPEISLWVIFVMGVVLTRSAGCVINDYCDRGMDGKVKRTKARPLVTGVVSDRGALSVFVGLMVLCCLLLYGLPPLSWAVACMGAVLLMVYPLTKRWIQAPQGFLGLTFSWGIPMAFAALNQSLDWRCWLLYGLFAVWVVVYDTIYGLVDRDDDLLLGVGSLAIWLGDYAQYAIALGYASVFMGLMVYGILLDIGWPYYVGVLFCAGSFVCQVMLVRTGDRKACFRAFLMNQYAGLFLFLGVLFAIVLH